VGAERDRVAGFGRLEDGLRQAGEWYRWGPYVSERQWGTVREDYSADGEAWDYLPHDHARSRAYRWGEDSLAGFCDVEQRLCLGLALWNGKDPILKERAFGLTGAQGNHGEDVKEYWWYLDALPSHAWNRWRYHYPQAAFPYQDLIEVNGARNREQPEYEPLPGCPVPVPRPASEPCYLRKYLPCETGCTLVNRYFHGQGQGDHRLIVAWMVS
jgi:hypothetical protein